MGQISLLFMKICWLLAFLQKWNMIRLMLHSEADKGIISNIWRFCPPCTFFVWKCSDFFFRMGTQQLEDSKDDKFLTFFVKKVFSFTNFSENTSFVLIHLHFHTFLYILVNFPWKFYTTEFWTKMYPKSSKI